MSLGDSSAAAEMPKSAYSANNQAKRRRRRHPGGSRPGIRIPKSRYRNTCWSFLAPDDSVKIGADYAPGDVKGKHVLVPSNSFVSQPSEKPAAAQGDL